MSLRTSLVLTGDATSAIAALDASSAALAASEKRALELAQAYYKADKATGTLASAQLAAKAATDQTKASYAAGEITLADYTRELLETKTALSLVSSEHQSAVGVIKKFGTGLQAVNTSAGQQKAGMQQLGFQIGDFTTQISSGTSFAQAFAQQIGQTGQAIQLMGGGTSKLGAFLGGPWGIAVTVALTALAPLVTKLFQSGEAAGDAARAQRSFTEVLNDSTSSWREVTAAAEDYANKAEKARKSTISLVQSEALAIAGRLNSAIAIRQETAALLEKAAAFRLSPELLQSGPGALGAADRLVGEIQARMAGNQAAINGLVRDQNESRIKVADAIAGVARSPVKAGFDVLRERARDTIKDIDALSKRLIELDRQQEAAEKRGQERNRSTRDKSSGFAPVTGSEVARLLHAPITSGTRSAERNREIGGAANSYHLTGQAIDIPLTVNGHPLTKAGIRSALEAAGVGIKELLGPGDRGHSDHFHVAFDKKRAGPDEIGRDQAKARSDEQRSYDASVKAGQHYVDQLKREGEEIGLTAQQLRILQHVREVGALPTAGLKRQAEEAFALNQIKDGALSAAEAIGGSLANAFRDASDGALDFIQKGIGDELERQGNAAQSLSDQISTIAQVMSSLGGAGRAIGGVIGGINSGDLGRIPGPAGALLGLLGNVKVGETDNGAIVRLGDRIQEIFKGDGPFAKTMRSVLEGTGLGLAAGSTILGGKNSGVGSSIGGALGDVLGKKVLTKGLESITKGLGQFAGPLGAIAGGVLGGLVGGLFKKTKTGSATVGSVNGQGEVTGTGGNSQSRTGAARGLAGSGLDALDRIIAQLGGEYGSFSASIGVRDKKFVVDPTGAGRTKGSGTQKYSSEEEATKALLADIIADGAVKGVSAAVQKALTSSPDIEKALKEALKVQDVEQAIGGIGAELQKAFTDFGRQAAERLRIGTQYGFDLVKIEERNAKDRLKLSEQLLDQQVGSLKRLVAELTGGSLFEGSAVDKRQAILGRIAGAKAETDAGVEGAADKLAGLLEQLNAVSKDVFATTGGFASDRASILDQARDSIAKGNQRIVDAQKTTPPPSDPALATTNGTLDEISDQSARMIVALEQSNQLLGAIYAQGGVPDYSNLKRLAGTGV